MMGSALKNTGIQLLLDGITYYLPNPMEKDNTAIDNANNEQQIVLKSDTKKPFVGYVCLLYYYFYDYDYNYYYYCSYHYIIFIMYNKIIGSDNFFGVHARKLLTAVFFARFTIVVLHSSLKKANTDN